MFDRFIGTCRSYRSFGFCLAVAINISRLRRSPRLFITTYGL
jgi:hypothetical protein